MWVQTIDKKGLRILNTEARKVEMGQKKLMIRRRRKVQDVDNFHTRGGNPHYQQRLAFKKILFRKQGATKGRKYNVATIAAPPLEAPD